MDLREIVIASAEDRHRVPGGSSLLFLLQDLRDPSGQDHSTSVDAHDAGVAAFDRGTIFLKKLTRDVF